MAARLAVLRVLVLLAGPSIEVMPAAVGGATTDPVDPGTSRVVGDVTRAQFDRDGLPQAVRQAVSGPSPA